MGIPHGKLRIILAAIKGLRQDHALWISMSYVADVLCPGGLSGLLQASFTAFFKCSAELFFFSWAACNAGFGKI